MEELMKPTAKSIAGELSQDSDIASLGSGLKLPKVKKQKPVDTLADTKKSGIEMQPLDYTPGALSEAGRKFFENKEENFDEVGLISDIGGMIDAYKKYDLDFGKFANKLADNKIARLTVEDMFPDIFGTLYKKDMLDENGKIPEDTYNYALRKGFKRIFNDPKHAAKFQNMMRWRAADEKAKAEELKGKK